MKTFQDDKKRKLSEMQGKSDRREGLGRDRGSGVETEPRDGGDRGELERKRVGASLGNAGRDDDDEQEEEEEVKEEEEGDKTTTTVIKKTTKNPIPPPARNTCSESEASGENEKGR